jgi:hypothetical protein
VDAIAFHVLAMNGKTDTLKSTVSPAMTGGDFTANNEREVADGTCDG